MKLVPGKAVNEKLSYKSLLLFFAIFAFSLAANQLIAQGTAFTYHGVLSDSAAPANGTYDLAFILRTNAGTGGNQLGPTLTNTAVVVSNGLFTATLDFGSVFDGSERYLEIYVRTNGASSFTQLNPRQPITPTPYAIFAQTAATAQSATSFSGTVPVANGGTASSNPAAGLANLGGVANNSGVSTNQSHYGTFASYGTVDLRTNSAYPSAELHLYDNQPIQFYKTPGDVGANIFWNSAHPGGGEFQITSEGSMSLNVGYNSQGTSTLQIGSTGGTHEMINIQYDADIDVAHPLGYSKNFRFITTYSTGSGHNYNFGNVLGIRGEATDTAGNAELVFYNPAHEVSGGRGPLGIYSGGVRQGAMKTNGWEFRGKMLRELKSLPPATNYLIDFEAPDFTHIDLTSSATFTVTNLNITNQITQKEIILQSGFGTLNLAFAGLTNWESETGPIPAPTVIAANTRLHIYITAEAYAGGTNIFASYKVGNYAPVTDPDAAAFFAASGISGATAKYAVNKLCLDMKQHGYYSNFLVLYPIAGTNSAQDAYNLINPSQYLITWHGSPLFTNGITGDAASAYGDTGFNPGTAGFASINSCMVFAWSRSASPTDGGWWLGAESPRFGILRNSNFASSDGLVENNINETLITCSPPANFKGFFAINRFGSTSQYGYNQVGVSATPSTVPATAYPNSNVYLLCRNSGGAFNFSTVTLGATGIAQNMTAQNMADLAADIAAYIAIMGE